MFAGINMATAVFCSFIPETRGLSLEDMDVVFGLLSVEKRQRDVLQVSNNLQHGALDGPNRGQHLFEEHSLRVRPHSREDEPDVESARGYYSYEKGDISGEATAY